MKKALIHYFTATGNTARATTLIKKELSGKYAVNIHNIIDGQPENISKYDAHIFAYPIYSWIPPAIVSRYIRKLPKGTKAPAAVLSVCGGGPGYANMIVERQLRRKKYAVNLSMSAHYPDNWTQMMEPPTKEHQKELLNSGDETVKKFCKYFLKEKKELHRAPLGEIFLTAIIGTAFRLVGRRMLGKCYIADSDCNSCGKCVKSCPVGMIKWRGKKKNRRPYWVRFNCEDCNRCINICPQQAVQTSPALLIAHIIANLLFIAGIIVGAIYALPFIHSKLSIYYAIAADVGFFVACIAAWLFGQFFLFDKLLLLLQQIKFFRRFFEKSFTKKYRRYVAPGFKV